MKSNQRREAKQPIRSKKQLQSPLRKLVEFNEEDGIRGSDESCSLLRPTRYLNEQVGDLCLVRDNQYSAISNKNSTHINLISTSTPSPLPSISLHHQINENNNNNNLEYHSQTMYNMTTMQSKSNKRYRSEQLVRRRRQTTNVSRILKESLNIINRPSLIFIVIALALSSCIFITHIQALSTSSTGETSDASSSSSSTSLSSTSASPSPAQSLASSVASSALSSLSSAIISAALQDGKSSSSERSNSPTANGGGGGGIESAPSASPTSPAGSSSPQASPSSSASASSSSSSSTSIAASLSSAVASAAAAAAVAAAQNSLSGGDARSLLTGSSSSLLMSPNAHHQANHHSHHQSRNPGLNLALKIADAIPEVPYNILHNMKKLDHAAPFYNVGNKIANSGNSKESTHGFLSSALHASGGLSGAAEQLSALFRSPIWKRIADGYGEFTSEFRSLFRAPPTTMKGPTSSTTKLLRDISVPALLMILASTIPNDWRPVRTRRKSLIPTELASLYPLADPMTASASSSSSYELPNYSAAPQLFSSAPTSNFALHQQQQQQQQQIIPQLQQQQHIGRGLNPLAQMYSQLDQSASSLNQARTNDINLQQADTASTVAWAQPSAVVQSEPTSSQLHNYETQMHQFQLQQHHPQQLQQQTHQQVIRRFGDSQANTALSLSNDLPKSQNPFHSNVKLVDGSRLHLSNLSTSLSSSPSSSSSSQNSLQTVAESLLSSLTSGLAHQVGHSKLMNRIMNVNTASGSGNDNLQFSNSYRMPLSPMNNEMPPMGRDHLSEKHRYSLVSNDNDKNLRSLEYGPNEQELSQPMKPFSLSAMSQALGSIIAQNSPLKNSGSTSAIYGGNSMGSNGVISRKMFTLNGNIDNGNLQNFFIGDKTINHHDTILRRNHQASGAMEQRELSKLIPQSWREVVKRTVNSVQEQATTQWRSIEGQLANWVQDKLKTIPASSVASSGSSASSSGSSSSSQAPVSNIFASVGTTALNILGLGGKSINGSSLVANSNVATTSSASPGESTATTSVTDESSSNSVLKNKNDQVVKSKQPSTKGALAGVANMIVNSLANRQVSPTSQSNPKPKTSTSSGETSSSSTNVGHYPTLTGVQATSSISTSSGLSDLSPSTASGTASTVAGMSLFAA